MINEIIIQNFKCFKDITVENCGQFNLIVGDSGSGKTSLLEAIFLAMNGNPEIAARYRVQRGLPNQFSGPRHAINEVMWGDIFYDSNLHESVKIALAGYGPTARTVEIFLGDDISLLPLEELSQDNISIEPPVTFRWTPKNGEPKIIKSTNTQSGLKLDGPIEFLPDNYYFYAGHSGNSTEAADRFSQLSRTRQAQKAKQIIINQYPWVKDITLEVSGGLPVLYAEVRGLQNLIPLANLSSGLNKIFNHVLAIMNTSGTAMLIDEVENGLYYQRFGEYWENIFSISMKNRMQIFATTHSREMLEAAANAARRQECDLKLIRIENADHKHFASVFDFDQISAAIEFEQEVR